MSSAIDIDAVLGGMADAPIYGSGNYMSAGRYLVALRKMKVIKSFEGALLFIAEFEIISSTNAAHAPGTTGSWAAKLEGKGAKSTLAEIKCLVCACLGIDASSVPAGSPDHQLAAALATAACGSEKAKAALAAMPDAPTVDELLGSRVVLECTPKQTDSGGTFTKYNWSPELAVS